MWLHVAQYLQFRYLKCPWNDGNAIVPTPRDPDLPVTQHSYPAYRILPLIPCRTPVWLKTAFTCVCHCIGARQREMEQRWAWDPVGLHHFWYHFAATSAPVGRQPKHKNVPKPCQSGAGLGPDWFSSKNAFPSPYFKNSPIPPPSFKPNTGNSTHTAYFIPRTLQAVKRCRDWHASCYWDRPSEAQRTWRKMAQASCGGLSSNFFWSVMSYIKLHWLQYQ